MIGRYKQVQEAKQNDCAPDMPHWKSQKGVECSLTSLDIQIE